MLPQTPSQGPHFPILHGLERIIYYLHSCQVKQYLQTVDCQLPRLFFSGTVNAAVLGIVCYLDDLSVCLNNAYGGFGSPHQSSQMMQEDVQGTIYWSPLSGDNVCSSPRHWLLPKAPATQGKQRPHSSQPLSIKHTKKIACLSKSSQVLLPELPVCQARWCWGN